MNIEHCVITAAGPRQSRLPLQRLIDRDGSEKSALRIILEEVFSGGIERVVTVISPGYRDAFADAVGADLGARVSFVEQPEPRGYADALLVARAELTPGPFLHLVGDHVYLGQGTGGSCTRQLLDVARAEGCLVSAVQATSERLIRHYGTVGGQRMASQPRLIEVNRVIEKPTPTIAEQELLIPGVRSGQYLCFFGMHVLHHGVLDQIERLGPAATVSGVLNELAAKERYLATELEGVRYDLGIPYGTLMAQLALALEGVNRDRVLSQVAELLIGQRLSAAQADRPA